MNFSCAAKFVAALLGLALAIALPSCQSGDDQPPKPKFAIVSANPAAPPMAWLEDGELRGAGIDVAKIVVNAIEVEPRILYEGEWDKVLDKAKNGYIDMVVGIYRTDEREEFLVFSEPYYSESVAVCVKKGKEFQFSRWDDLKGRKGVLGYGESYGEDFDKFAEMNLNIVRRSTKECFSDLVSGKADYTVISLRSGMIASWQYGYGEDVSFLDIPVTNQSYHLALSKKSPFVGDMPKINQRIRSMRVAGTPELLAAKYLISWKNRFILLSPTDMPNSPSQAK